MMLVLLALSHASASVSGSVSLCTQFLVESCIQANINLGQTPPPPCMGTKPTLDSKCCPSCVPKNATFPPPSTGTPKPTKLPVLCLTPPTTPCEAGVAPTRDANGCPSCLAIKTCLPLDQCPSVPLCDANNPLDRDPTTCCFTCTPPALAACTTTQLQACKASTIPLCGANEKPTITADCCVSCRLPPPTSVVKVEVNSSLVRPPAGCSLADALACLQTVKDYCLPNQADVLQELGSSTTTSTCCNPICKRPEDDCPLLSVVRLRALLPPCNKDDDASSFALPGECAGSCRPPRHCNLTCGAHEACMRSKDGPKCVPTFVKKYRVAAIASVLADVLDKPLALREFVAVLVDRFCDQPAAAAYCQDKEALLTSLEVRATLVGNDAKFEVTAGVNVGTGRRLLATDNNAAMVDGAMSQNSYSTSPDTSASLRLAPTVLLLAALVALLM